MHESRGILQRMDTSGLFHTDNHDQLPLKPSQLRANKRSGWMCQTVCLMTLGAFSCAVAGMMIGRELTWVAPVFFVIGGGLSVCGFWDIYSLCTNREKKLFPDENN